MLLAAILFIVFSFFSKYSFKNVFSEGIEQEDKARRLAIYLSLPACMTCSSFYLIKFFINDIDNSVAFIILASNVFILFLIKTDFKK